MSPPGSSSFNQTLQFITSIKLKELDKQRSAHIEHAKIIDEAKAAGDAGGVLKRVEVLAKSVKRWTGSGRLDPTWRLVGNDLHLDMLDFWLQQAKKDPSFNLDAAEKWIQTLEDHIRNTSMRFDGAKLFGSLLSEWLASGDSSVVEYQLGVGGGDTVGVARGGSSADAEREEMLEQKEKFVSLVFDAHPVDEAQIKGYLERLFEEEEAGRALERLRKEMKDHGRWLASLRLSRNQVKDTIKGLLASGLMDEEKRSVLKAFLGNNTVLDEVASVLNMRLASFDSWAWPEGGVSVEMRKALNGRYRAFTDPEIIDGLFLHYIGVSWQIRLKGSLKRFFHSKAWSRPDPLEHPTREAREAQTCSKAEDSIFAQREASYASKFFLSQLNDTFSTSRSYDDNVDGVSNAGKRSFVDVKQQLLNLLATDCRLNKAVSGTHTILRSDMEWFGPSLPHQTILSTLSFLGMPTRWVTFINAFLTAPIRFQGQETPRVRRRGTPFSYALSTLCGEAILFVMDYAVNKSTQGLNLFRIHDDLWLWDADASRVAKGWTEMQEYAAAFGLKYNEEKTGSTTIHTGPKPAEETSRLPQGAVRWGFLEFDPSASRFVIDQRSVDEHIAELRLQLQSSRSVFGWVNVYNKYMAFMLRNFGGPPANCFPRDHLDDLTNTLARIQRELFPNSHDKKAGAVHYLRNTIQERFGIEDLPEGYFYTPISAGGLGLRNVMLELFVLEKRGKPLSSYTFKHRSPAEIAANPDPTNSTKEDEDDEDDHRATTSDEADDEDDYIWDDGKGRIVVRLVRSSEDPTIFDEYKTSPDVMFSRRMTYDHIQYKKLKEQWDLDQQNRRESKPHLKMSFMTFEEYQKLRETWLQDWGQTYKYMQASPEIKSVPLPPRIEAAVKASSSRWGRVRSTSWYDKWIVSLYGEEVLKRFGGLEVVDPNVIPIGMVELFKSSKMKLKQ